VYDTDSGCGGGRVVVVLARSCPAPIDIPDTCRTVSEHSAMQVYIVGRCADAFAVAACVHQRSSYLLLASTTVGDENTRDMDCLDSSATAPGS
jgi:hypothetical protein